MTTHSTFSPSSAARWTQCPADGGRVELRITNDVRWLVVRPELTAQQLDLIQHLNWRAYLLACVTGSPPFTPYHAASKARRTLRFSEEHKS